MYHITGKTSKQVLRTVLNNVGKRQTIAAAQRIALIPSNVQGASFFVLNNNFREVRALNSYVTRSFSSFPPHTKLEMPNLSPTMEKVLEIFLIYFIGKHC